MNFWLRILVSLLGGGMLTELIHITSGDPDRPMRYNFSLLYALIIFFLLSFFFGKKPKSRISRSSPKTIKQKNAKTFDVKDMGIFSLVYSKRNKNLWSIESNGRISTVNGTENEPSEKQVDFLRTVDKEIERLSSKFNQKFKNEFKEAGMKSGFTNWSERFKIGAIEVMLIYDNDAYWNITFEDTLEPFAHFTLYIEGEKLTDFAIDT